MALPVPGRGSEPQPADEAPPLVLASSWPSILEMARGIEARVTAGDAVDAQEVRRLANAVLLFQTSLVRRPR